MCLDSCLRPLQVWREHTWARWATLTGPDSGTGTGRHGAGDEGTHLPSAVAVALAAAIVPILSVVVPTAIHGQAGAQPYQWSR